MAKTITVIAVTAVVVWFISTAAFYADYRGDFQAAAGFADLNHDELFTAYSDSQPSDYCQLQASAGSIFDDRSITNAICLSMETRVCKEVACEMNQCGTNLDCLSDWNEDWNTYNCDAVEDVCEIDRGPNVPGPRPGNPGVDCGKEAWWLQLGCVAVFEWDWF